MRSKPTQERNRCQSPMLPGLAITCLIRVPQAEDWKLRLVFTRWQRFLVGNSFHSFRKSLGIAAEWIYVIRRWTSTSPSPPLWLPTASLLPPPQLPPLPQVEAVAALVPKASLHR
ncbi:hypothetical protein B296_00051196 [Ensete ventricosum]|uniref:Uncharacterized protein n=1 Tax=Ensete ventricosum TaxID=4639 RepID=A0A426XNH7_ENSVE|nr:hypothetical protein B296_00051196 [Ensete ventricosum]